MVLQLLSQAGSLYVGPAVATGARKGGGRFSTCTLLMSAGAQHLNAQLSVLPRLHFKADSTSLPAGTDWGQWEQSQRLSMCSL